VWRVLSLGECLLASRKKSVEKIFFYDFLKKWHFRPSVTWSRDAKFVVLIAVIWLS